MNAAFVHGKIIADSEDRLTSDIFGLLKYLPPRILLWPLLGKADSFDPTPYKLDKQMSGWEPESVKYFFWPKAGARQPDMLILLSDSRGHVAAVIVEVKYTCGKNNINRLEQFLQAEPLASNEPLFTSEPFSDGDQLSDYFWALLERNVTLRTGRTHSSAVRGLVERKNSEDQAMLASVARANKFLLYLTADASPPIDEIQETITSLDRSHHSSDYQRRLYWLSWHSVYQLAEAALSTSSESTEKAILMDIVRLLDLRDLRCFKGWRNMNLDVPLRDDGSKFFWRQSWFRDICLPKIEFDQAPYFWRATSTR